MKQALNIFVEERRKVTSDFAKAMPDEKAHRHKVGWEREVITESPEETRKLAADLAKELKPGSVLALYGELGSGKTCFVQGLAEGLEIKEFVNSPTFTIVNEYNGRCCLYHVDLYRVKSVSEADLLGLDDYLEGKGITAVEWPEQIESILPKNTARIYFEFLDINRRRIRIGRKADG